MEIESKKLVMKFDPRTIEHLGIKMYSRIPIALAELIANSYDAKAKEVLITLEDGENKRIIVKDDGDGMSFDEVNDKFLIIGRNRREQEGVYSSDGKRKVTGKKGLGKLALFGVGDTIKIETIKNDEKVSFELDWGKLKSSSGDYKPEFSLSPAPKEKTGTIITLTNLKRSSDFNAQDLAISISKLFNFFDKDFKVFIKKGESVINVDNALKYSEIEEEFGFDFPEFSSKILSDYTHRENIRGKILTTELPLKPGLRGITLFANGRLVNAPEFFGRSESSHFYSYVTGWLEVDFLDELNEDIISTNRQSLNWDFEETQKLRDFLQKILSELQTEWREKRGEKRRVKIKEVTKVDVQNWYSKLPDEVLTSIEPMINTIIDKSELSAEEQTKVVQRLHTIVPEYPRYHWRHLHPEVQDSSKEKYQNQDYYDAFLEAAKRYINSTRTKSTWTGTNGDFDMMAKVFGHKARKLSVAKKYKRPDGVEFNPDTKKNLEDGQKYLSQGVVAGGRNIVGHEEMTDLKDSGLFTENDCLDMLSVLSHLCRRLEDSQEDNLTEPEI